MVGQSSNLSGIRSTTRSSFCVEHGPLFTTPARTQTSGPMMLQVHCWLLLVQRFVGFWTQNPLVGHWPLVVQTTSLVRLHVPGMTGTIALPGSTSTRWAP